MLILSTGSPSVDREGKGETFMQHERIKAHVTERESRRYEYAMTDHPPVSSDNASRSPMRPTSATIEWNRVREDGTEWGPWSYRIVVRGPNVKADGTDGQRRMTLPYWVASDMPEWRWLINETRPEGDGPIRAAF